MRQLRRLNSRRELQNETSLLKYLFLREKKHFLVISHYYLKLLTKQFEHILVLLSLNSQTHTFPDVEIKHVENHLLCCKHFIINIIIFIIRINIITIHLTNRRHFCSFQEISLHCVEHTRRLHHQAFHLLCCTNLIV